MRDHREVVRQHPNRRRSLVGAVAVVLAAATIVVVPHFLKTSPTTNDDTDPTNGVPFTHGTTAP